MLGAEKFAKLEMLFNAMPEEGLRQLHQAFDFGAKADPDGMPYDQLIGLVEQAAQTRNIILVTEKKSEPPVEPVVESDVAAMAEEADEPREIAAEYLELEAPNFVVPRNMPCTRFSPLLKA